MKLSKPLQAQFIVTLITYAGTEEWVITSTIGEMLFYIKPIFGVRATAVAWAAPITPNGQHSIIIDVEKEERAIGRTIRIELKHLFGAPNSATD